MSMSICVHSRAHPPTLVHARLLGHSLDTEGLNPFSSH